MGKATTVALIAIGSFVAGILLAPKSGKETRQDLMDKADEYKTKAKAGIKEVKKGADVVKDELVEGADSAKKIAKDVSDDLKDGAGRFKNEASTRAKTIGEEVKQTSRHTREATR